MGELRYGICPLCDASCGVEVELRDGRAVMVRGDLLDPLSRGHICPKGASLPDIQYDPDRVVHPMRRHGARWEEIPWDEALSETAGRIGGIQALHGRDAVGVYAGNPVAHSFSALIYGLALNGALRTRNLYTANSVDSLPRTLASLLMFGSQAVIPVPDVERTSFLLIIGANPAVSNGSAMTAPDFVRRIGDIRTRGGRVVVIDPRRTETARLADEHHFIRPGTDALVLSSMIRTVFEEALVRRGAIGPLVDGVDKVRGLVDGFAPERVAPISGIDAAEIRRIVRAFVAAPAAACHTRMGTSTQEFGTLSTWLVDVLHVLTGNLDRPGGAMFATPAVDLAAVAGALGQNGHFDRWRSRVRGLPEFNGELPVVTLADEIETPGEGQVRALLTFAGNPVLSVPDGRRLDGALSKLEFMASIDIYLNETTRHADIILPTSFGLEQDHFALLPNALAVRNTARYAPAILEPPPGVRNDWEILLDLSIRIMDGGFSGGTAGRFVQTIGQMLGRRVRPRSLLSLLIQTGPYGSLFGNRSLSLDRLLETPHGIDLGPPAPRFPGLLRTADKRIHLAPDLLANDMVRLRRFLERESAAAASDGDAGPGTLLLVGRRDLRSNNSWMHNVPRLMKGKDRCTLLMHPQDAEKRGIADGTPVKVATRTGEIEVTVEIDDSVMPGVVCLPHGFGHSREGARLSVASAHAGVSANDIGDGTLTDELSGCARLSGIPVSVSSAHPGPKKRQVQPPTR